MFLLLRSLSLINVFFQVKRWNEQCILVVWRFPFHHFWVAEDCVPQLLVDAATEAPGISRKIREDRWPSWWWSVGPGYPISKVNMPIFTQMYDVYKWYSKRTVLLSKHLVPPQLYVGHGTRAEGGFWQAFWDQTAIQSMDFTRVYHWCIESEILHSHITILSKSLCNMMIHDQFIPVQVYSLPAAHTIPNKTGSYNTQPLIPPSIVFGIWRCMLKDAKTFGAMSARSADPGACPFHAARFRRGKHPGGPSTPKYWSKSSSICVSVRSFWRCGTLFTSYGKLSNGLGPAGLQWCDNSDVPVDLYALSTCSFVNGTRIVFPSRDETLTFHIPRRKCAAGLYQMKRELFDTWREEAWVVVSVELLDVVGGWILNAMLCVPSIHARHDAMICHRNHEPMHQEGWIYMNLSSSSSLPFRTTIGKVWKKWAFFCELRVTQRSRKVRSTRTSSTKRSNLAATYFCRPSMDRFHDLKM